MLVFFIVFGLTLLAFLLVIAGMAVGVLMGRREISGSCGGIANQAEGETSCSMCSNPDAACRELRERMQGNNAEQAGPAVESMSRGEGVSPSCDTR